MRARGKQSLIRKAPRRDARAHSSARGIVEGSPQYWDLVNGGGHWSDPDDPDRRAAWEEWRDRILERWTWPPGSRPAGWIQFDLPLLLNKARPWRRDMLERWNDPADAGRQIPLSELIFGLKTTSADERSAIEDEWCGWIATAAENPDVDIEDVPPWFVEAVRKGEAS
jgi:hypothetical protein